MSSLERADQFLSRYQVVLGEGNGERLPREDRLRCRVGRLASQGGTSKPAQRPLLLRRRVRPSGNQRYRQRRLLERRPAAQQERSLLVVKSVDRAGRVAGRRIEDRVAGREMMLLGREAEGPDER